MRTPANVTREWNTKLELAAYGRRVLKVAPDAGLGIVRRADGAVAFMISGINSEADETAPGLEVVNMLSFARLDDAIAARAGALTRLGRQVGPDGWITGLSVGQVLAAFRAEVDALRLDASSFHILTSAEPEPEAKTNVLGLAIAAVLLAFAAFWIFVLTFTFVS